MAFFSTAKKKAEKLTEKGLAGVSGAIYATGNVFGKAGAVLTTNKIHEALDSRE